MSIFVSYSRSDEETVKVLARGFEKVEREVWYDHELEAGEIWWDTILHQIRATDVFLFAKSDNSLTSKACLAELDYARALQRPVLPVQIGPVSAERSNVLADQQHVVFRPDDVTTAFEVLLAAQHAAKRAGPLPDPLPPEPAIPFAYLGDIRRKIDTGKLDNNGQLDVITQLRRSLAEETDASARKDILALLTKMRNSPWRSMAAGLEIHAVISAYEAMEREIAGQPVEEPEIPHEITESPPAPEWSEDDARRAFIARINELVGQLHEGRARGEARGTGETLTADEPSRHPQETKIFRGVGLSEEDGGMPELPWEVSSEPAPEWAVQPESEQPTMRFAGVGRTGPAESVAETTKISTDASAREQSSAAQAKESTGETAEHSAGLFLPAVTYAGALAIAALVVSVAFAVLVVAVGRGSTAVTFALPVVSGLVALIASGAAAKRAAAGNEAGARRSSILGIVWGLVGVAVAVAALAVILSNPMPI